MSKHRKTVLKELADKGVLQPAEFDTRREGGTDHDPGFVATVTVGDTTATGVGRTKSAAEDHAAAAVLQKLGK